MYIFRQEFDSALIQGKCVAKEAYMLGRIG